MKILWKTLCRSWLVLTLLLVAMPAAGQSEGADEPYKPYKPYTDWWLAPVPPPGFPEDPADLLDPPPKDPVAEMPPLETFSNQPYYGEASVDPGEVVPPVLEPAIDPSDALETDATTKIYRFGEAATVRCAPRLACSIDLEAGETIRGRALGDPDRWDYSELVSGPAGSERMHVVVRPTDYAIHTNLIVTTDRRAYRVRLVAIDYPEDPDSETVEFTETVAFRYPERWVEKRTAPPVRAPAAELAVRAAPSVTPPTEAPSTTAGALPTEPESPTARPIERVVERMNFDYRVVQPRRKKHRFDWEPLAIFDDGRHTYIHLPPLYTMDVAPVLSGIDPMGQPYPLNATLRGQVFVVPRLVKRAELYLGVGKKRRWLRIERLDRGG